MGIYDPLKSDRPYGSLGPDKVDRPKLDTMGGAADRPQQRLFLDDYDSKTAFPMRASGVDVRVSVVRREGN